MIPGTPRASFLFSILFMATGLAGVVWILPLVGGIFPGAGVTLMAYALVTLLIGTAGGLAFRGVALALGGRGGASGGLIYTLDILGTSLGGWQAGSVLIPMLGIQTTLLCAGGAAALLCVFCALLIPASFTCTGDKPPEKT
jgi:hypothetical protein